MLKHAEANLSALIESKAAEERLAAAMNALRVSEEHYRTVFQISIDAISVTHQQDGRVVDVNQEYLRMFGYEREEVIGRTTQELLIWTDPLDRSRMVEALCKEPVIRDMEFFLQRKNGQRFWVMISGSRIDLDGVPSFLIVLRDISSAKAASEALRASEERYRTAFQTSLDAINITRIDDGKFIDCNQAFLDAMGFEREEVFGRTSLELRIWADARDRQTMMNMLRQNSRVCGLEVQLRKKDGEIGWGQISASMIEIDGVRCILSITRDISAAKAAEKTIRSLAFYDPLTGLPNRRHLMERLRQPLDAGTRSGRSQALLLIDLDHFKTLNDTLGHQTGDLMLQEAARRIVACIHEADTVCRLGGDEFVVVLEDMCKTAEEAAAHAEAVGKKVLDAIDQPFLIGDHECLSTASIGIAVFGNREGNTDEILQQAEIALYQAKAAGRNILHFFSPALQAVVNARAALEEDLRQGIKEKQFLLYYQPQVERGRVTGSEALVRWMHPTRGLVMPNDFIPLAEESRLILPLGDWVLEAACAQIALWAGRKETAHLSVAVNISALQFRQPSFVEQVRATLRRTGANPDYLRLELTESMLVENLEDIIAKMTELKSHGLRFSLDDFGTGYSSLTYLKRLPLDRLKIDRSFVHDMMVDATSGAIAQTILSLGRAMGISVIAEGVETEEQRGYLAALGCHSFQGYLFSRPLPLDKFEAFLQGFAESGGPH
jgi:diguanylate cyclase (GGDEF)-like protein/PAS domain S-box-containing protein